MEVRRQLVGRNQLPPVPCEHQTQVLRLCGKPPYLLSHLAGPQQQLLLFSPFSEDQRQLWDLDGLGAHLQSQCLGDVGGKTQSSRDNCGLVSSIHTTSQTITRCSSEARHGVAYLWSLPPGRQWLEDLKFKPRLGYMVRLSENRGNSASSVQFLGACHCPLPISYF